MRVERWRRLTEWPLTAAAVAFLGLYAWRVIGNIRPPDADGIRFALLTLWALFLANYIVTLLLTHHRRRWFLRHLPELTLALFPFLGPLQLLRLVGLIQVLHHTAGNALRGRVSIYLVVSAALIVFVGAVAILDVEQNSDGALITNIGDAVWWTLVTVTTVGYGDLYPVTALGRLIAAGLMLVGIALIGAVTATFASWFVERAAADRIAEAAEHREERG
ncbi:potassium channel family protein [Lysobacter korlensis]|uniref:Potassium channel family protein n=1 Tax=Lysobacter korlensis TaxID=553636 RepID=A0ABV6RXU2_9GAMM